MTRKLQNTAVEEGKSRRRVLKPVVEKKRRDRINQSLAELKTLLFNHTCDPRLQNPIEKAEILDLAVEYLQKWTEEKNSSCDSVESQPRRPLPPPMTLPPHPEPVAPSLYGMETAGFQQCVAQLTSYMHKIPPGQRASLMEGLRRQADSREQPELRASEAESSSDAICTSERRELLLFPPHSPFQPHACSTPHHDYLSPPTSPWLSPSLSTYSPGFPSFASHFSFPPSLSPLSSNTSFFSVSPPIPHCSPPSLPSLRCPPQPALREGSPPQPPPALWRPWF